MQRITWIEWDRENEQHIALHGVSSEDDHQGETLLPTETTGKMTKRLPSFRSAPQEARFWDTHGSTDYLDQFEDDLETLFVRPESGLIEVSKRTRRQLLLSPPTAAAVSPPEHCVG